MREQELEPFQSVGPNLKCLEAVAHAVFDAFDHYYSRIVTWLRQRSQMGLLEEILINVADLRATLTLVFFLADNERTLLYYDVMRMLAGLEHMDLERAVWSFMTAPQNCDPAFKRVVEFSSLISSFHAEGLKWAHGRSCWIEAIGGALWQVSCPVPRSLSPSPPPPPYTLYAFNIELPPIRYPAVTTRRSSVGQSLRFSMRRQSISEDVDTLRPSMRRISDAEDVKEIRPDGHTGPEGQDIEDEDEDEHPPKRRLLNEPENVEYIREQRLLRFQGAA